MKRLTLELGGKSPNIILDDADFSTAIPMAVAACYLNNGQACIAASRLIVPEDRLGEVKRLVRAAVEQIKMGDPRNKDVTLGPLASIKQYKRVQEYIKSGIEEGAELVIGGGERSFPRVVWEVFEPTALALPWCSTAVERDA